MGFRAEDGVSDDDEDDAVVAVASVDRSAAESACFCFDASKSVAVGILRFRSCSVVGEDFCRDNTPSW